MRVAINGAGETWKSWRERGPERRYRERLSITAIKLFADGALGSRGAALLEPYADDARNTGLERAATEDIERWARDAFDAGFQVCTHAIGDRANRSVLDAYARALAGRDAGALRPRIEHAQVLAPDDLPRVFDPPPGGQLDQILLPVPTKRTRGVQVGVPLGPDR